VTLFEKAPFLVVSWNNFCTYAPHLIHFSPKILIVMQRLIPAILFALTVLVSCSKSDDDQAKTQNDLWAVSSYLVPDANGNPHDNLKDETALFSGYTFEFNDNNEWIFHSPSGSATTAKWGLDAATSTVAFTADNAPAPIDELMGVWVITEQTNTTLKLKGQDIVTTPDDLKGVVEFQKL